MTRAQQRKFLRSLTREVRDHLLARSKDWPPDWDGHELRDLLAAAFERERSPLMRAPRNRRRRDFENARLTRNLI